MGRKTLWLQHVFNRLSVYYRGSQSYGIKTTSVQTLIKKVDLTQIGSWVLFVIFVF